jgi:predicted DNA-binding transcriptional regulator AlpA
MFLDQIISQADSSAEPTHREVGHQTHPQSDTAKYTYLGLEAHGRFRVSKDGITYLVSGILYERRRYADESGQKKWKRHKVATTPGYGNQADSEHSVIARCVNSGVMYRIVGVFQAEVALPIDEAVALKADTTASATALAAHEPQCISARLDKTHQVKAVKRHNFASIVAQREAGLDPDLRMSFIAVFLNESKANLYRKMGKGFPPPIKRGKGSFWPMSQIEAYKAGQLVGGAS